MDALRIVVNGGSYISPSIAREIVNHLMGRRVSKASILTDRQKEMLKLEKLYQFFLCIVAGGAVLGLMTTYWEAKSGECGYSHRISNQ